ncbi:hypothetical protein MNBD_BACTEROID03-940 [hydrothermal vent metagenome]|uniref:Uncharacterized protein n=1 Tax=hydrothermal vent metagenome TaxID=652676 RepID=A0A3B0SYT0_9ZZZZ
MNLSLILAFQHHNHYVFEVTNLKEASAFSRLKKFKRVRLQTFILKKVGYFICGLLYKKIAMII